MATTITPNHEAQMRPLVLTVTANHTLAFVGGDVHSTVDWPVTETQNAAIQYWSLTLANDIRKDALGATAALLASVFWKRAQ